MAFFKVGSTYKYNVEADLTFEPGIVLVLRVDERSMYSASNFCLVLAQDGKVEIRRLDAVRREELQLVSSFKLGGVYSSSENHPHTVVVVLGNVDKRNDLYWVLNLNGEVCKRILCVAIRKELQVFKKGCVYVFKNPAMMRESIGPCAALVLDTAPLPADDDGRYWILDDKGKIRRWALDEGIRKEAGT